jgi:hypothetical protein
VINDLQDPDTLIYLTRTNIHMMPSRIGLVPPHLENMDTCKLQVFYCIFVKNEGDLQRSNRLDCEILRGIWRASLFPRELTIFYIIIIIIILLIIRVIKVNFEIYEWQRVTDSGAEQTRHCQWRLCIKQCKRVTDSDIFALAHSDHNPLSLDQHYYCQSTTKDTTDSDALI